MRTTEHVLVSVKQNLNDEVLFESGVKLYLDPTYNPEWNATVTGKVAATSDKKLLGHKINEGDEVAFSFKVCSHKTYPPFGDAFYPTTEGSEHIQEWRNGKGEILRKLALPGAIGIKWVTTYLSPRFDLISGAQGTESDVDRFIAQFPFKNTAFHYTNLVHIDQTDFWKVSKENLIARKKGEDIEMLVPALLCKPIEVDVTKLIEIQEGIILPPNSVKQRMYDRAEVVSGGEKLDVKKGDIISFEPTYVSKYDMWGKQYFIVPERRVLARWI